MATEEGTDGSGQPVDGDAEKIVRVDAPTRDSGSEVRAGDSADVDAEAATRVTGAEDEAAPTPQPDPDTDFDPDGRTRVTAKRPISPDSPASGASGAGASTPAAAGGVAIGEVLFGEYEILEVLGAGGMGEVYKAWHRRLEEPRAIKMMHADLSTRKGANEFFLREAKALLAVRHPAVVHCNDLLSDDRGRVYLIMELIEGVALSERMKQGPLPTDEVILLGARLAAGLAAAHRRGVVHRDVSPDNVVLPDGDVSRAKLIDFGIAKLLDEGQGTIVDGFKGKLSYASPEQLGFFGGEIDGRSDFYSLGLVLSAAALGRPIGMGTTVMEAVDARRHLARLPDEIPVGLRSALEPLLALDPADRPKRAEQLFVSPDRARSLDEDDETLPPRPRSSTAPAAASVSGALPWIGGAAGLALMLGIGGYVLSGGGGSSEPGADRIAAESQPSPALENTGPVPSPPPEQSVAAEAPEVVAPKPAEEKRPAPVKRVSALDKVRIVGLLRGADAALAENRLQSPKGDNAFEKYTQVLRIDSNNREAKRGLVNVATRYLGLTEQALRADDLEQAKAYLSKASSIAPHHPRLGDVRAAVNSAGS
jgi:serine/threonine-protein kinase